MNEADAKKCWCPMVRIAPLARPIEEMTLVDNRGNPGAEFAPDTRCLGSECMAWRAYDDESGYCGLAGAPINSNQGERT